MGHTVHIPIKNTPSEYLLKAEYFNRISEDAPTLPWYLSQFCQFGMRTSKAGYFLRYARRWEGVQAMKRLSFDVVHPTETNSLEVLNHLNGKALVVTIHDMIHELRPECFAAHDPSAHRKKIMIEQATRIIAISQKTKDDIIRLYKVATDKIDVIHHGNSLCLPEHHEEKQLHIPQRYVLYVGQRNSYKNFPRTLHAMKVLMEKHNEVHLICAGGGAFKEDEQNLINELGIADRVQQMWVSDEELAILYNRALCFIYPSEYEGFGLPILEAFNCHTPVLCADASCFPEVAGDAALYFNPTDIKEMTQRMELMCSDEQLREDYIARGRERIKLFSWRSCAEKTLACYQKAIQSKQSADLKG